MLGMALGMALLATVADSEACAPQDTLPCLRDTGLLQSKVDAAHWYWVGPPPALARDEQGRPALQFQQREHGTGVGAWLNPGGVKGKWLMLDTELKGEANAWAGPIFTIWDDHHYMFQDPARAKPACSDVGNGWRHCTMAVYVPPVSSRVLLNVVAFGGSVTVRSLTLTTKENSAFASPPAAARVAFEKASGIMQQRFFKSAQVDWPALTTESEPWLSSPIHDGGELASAWMASRLPSHGHTAVLDNAGASDWTEKTMHLSTPGVSDTTPVARKSADGLAYLRLPKAPSVVAGMSRDSQKRYVQQAHDAITSVATQAQQDWVVDLRGNSGGDIYTLLAAIAPVVGTHPHLGDYRSEDGKTEPFGLSAAGPTIGTYVFSDLPRQVQRAPFRSLTLIVDRGCASACEIAVGSLQELPGVRIVGQQTWGVSTANSPIPVNDVFRLQLTTAYCLTASGRMLDGPIHPTETLTGDDYARIAALAGQIQQVPPDGRQMSRPAT